MPKLKKGAGLTEREKEVLRLIVEDMTAREIAAALNVSVKTVEFHRASIKRKINVRGPCGMLRYALKARIVTLTALTNTT
jgi:DNA-binding CsgD family transcriptional regulator